MKKLTVGILAHVDAGKTTLAEALLFAAGTLRKLGRVDKRDTFLDTYVLERKRGITIFSKQAVFHTGGCEITLIDTPGHADFSPETERTLCILDAAILVISAADGVQSHTETLWKLLERHRIPTFLFVNKTDLPYPGKEVLLADLHRRLSPDCVAAEALGSTEETAVCSESLMEKYLSGEPITETDLAVTVAERRLFPVFFGSALKNEGVVPFLEKVTRLVPCADGTQSAFGARIFKITYDERGTRLTHMKITGGVLAAKHMLSGTSEAGEAWSEKAEQIRVYSGTHYETLTEAGIGTVCAVTGLTHTRAGEGLGFEKADFAPLSEPVLSYAIRLPQGVDAFTAFSSFRRLEEEEPMFRFAFSSQSGEITVSVMGEVQLEVLAHRILETFGMEVTFGAGRVLYRETVADTVEGVGHFEPLRHYSEVHLLLEPGERGSGMRFASDCDENELARNWQRLILTHLAEKTHVGVLTGAPLTDIKVTVVAGRAHKKHTEGGDFREATYRALRQGLRKARCVLLEPWYSFTIELPEDCVGRAMSDVQRMGGRFGAPEQSGGTAHLTGTVPVSEMRLYALTLAGYTGGRGRLTLSLHGYEPCHNADEVIAASGYQPDADLLNPSDSVFCANGAGFVVPWNEVEAHMHVESVLKRAAPEDSAERTVRQRAADYLARAASEKELMEIFERTYGKIKKRESAPVRYNPSVTGVPSAKPKKQTPAPVFDGKEYLLVDGYNLIFAWDELRAAASKSLEGARNDLIHRLCNYQGYCGIEIILVFDAYRVHKNPGSVEKFRNISVVYTKEAETADTYIERVSHELSKKHRVKVATSDGPEQMIILGNGALRVPAAAFHKELCDTEAAIRSLIDTPFE